MSAGHKTRTKDKYRVVYTEHQKVELEKEFLFSQYITIQRKAELAGSIGLSDRQVKIWFQNRRAKERKSRRRRDDGPNTSSVGVASVAPATVGGDKSAVLDDTSRLRGQLQPQHVQHLQPGQYQANDVIKMENVSLNRSRDNIASSTPQQTGVYCVQ